MWVLVCVVRFMPCFFRKSHSIKRTTHTKTHIQPTTHKCHNPQPTKSKFPFSIMDEDCSQMLRDIRVQSSSIILKGNLDFVGCGLWHLWVVGCMWVLVCVVRFMLCDFRKKHGIKRTTHTKTHI